MLNSLELGLIIKSTPSNPINIADILKKPIFSLKNTYENKVTINGIICKIAIIFANGRLKRALKKNKVAATSEATLRIMKNKLLLSILFLNEFR